MNGKRTIHICPRCNVRFVASPECDSIEHECNSGNTTLDQEDVVVVGNWTDYTGSGTASLVNYQGVENELQMKRGGIEGEDENPVTRRGNTASTHRQRQHIEFIKLN